MVVPVHRHDLGRMLVPDFDWQPLLIHQHRFISHIYTGSTESQIASQWQLTSRVVSNSLIDPFPHPAMTWFLNWSAPVQRERSKTYSWLSFQATAYTLSWVSNLLGMSKGTSTVARNPTDHLTTFRPPWPICSTCNLPFPTSPKFVPDATAILSSKNGEKATLWCANPGVLTRSTGPGGGGGGGGALFIFLWISSPSPVRLCCYSHYERAFEPVVAAGCLELSMHRCIDVICAHCPSR